MPAKYQIIGELGQEELLLPESLERALAANDRIKLCFSLLQAAESHANHPEQPILMLFAGIGDADIERSIPESRLQPDGSLHFPRPRACGA